MRSLDDGLLIQALLPYRDSIWIDTGTGFDKRSNAGENFVIPLRSLADTYDFMVAFGLSCLSPHRT